jgi:transposase
MSSTPSSSSSEEEVTIKYVCGIDVGSQSCAGCICGPEKRVVARSSDFANTTEGWKVWEEQLAQLDAAPNQILIGMEATSRYHENLGTAPLGGG